MTDRQKTECAERDEQMGRIDRVDRIRRDEHIDETGFGDIKVIQTRGTGYGIDAVLLAAFAAGETGAPGIPTRKAGVSKQRTTISAGAEEKEYFSGNRTEGEITDAADPCKESERNDKSAMIADLGTGSGIVAFALHHKLRGAVITGFDVNAEAIDRARRAGRMNGLEQDIDFVCCDVKDLIAAARAGRGSTIEADNDALHCETAGAKDMAASGSFDAVVSNPPYFRRTPDEPAAKEPDDRYTARHETTADIGDFTAAAAALLREGGSLYMVHRPDRLADIITAMRAAGIEPKTMQLVEPGPGCAANILLIHGIKGAGAELRMLPEIVVRGSDGAYTDAIMHIYEKQ